MTTESSSSTPPAYAAEIRRAAKAIKEADAFIFTCGAGMGVDSGLPDFRGPEGFWKAYPPMKKLGLQFSMMSNPLWFENDPHFAWGFWGHRYKLYSTTPPHAGFDVVKRIAASKENAGGYFIFTSNVDGSFQKAGFPEKNLIECHGSVHWMQCSKSCTKEIWSNEGLVVNFSEETFKATDLPTCKNCGAVARPNVLMFGDWGWIGDRCSVQDRLYVEFQTNVRKNKYKLVVIEVGAGLAVPTVRFESESLGGQLIRINLRDTDCPQGAIVIPLGGKDALTRIEQAMSEL